MIYINLLANPPSAEWLKRADAITKLLVTARTKAQRTKIIDENKALWGELKDYLSKLRNRKCWYSESINDGAHCHIDHFRPKTNALNELGKDLGGYYWLAFDWTNYRYAGPAPNVRKKDYFPVLKNKANKYGDNIGLEDILLLDPVVIGDPSKLIFDAEGKVIPKSIDINSRDFKKAFFSIEKYNLNMEGLKEGRREKLLKTTMLINEAQNLLAQESIKHDAARENEIMGIWKDLRELAHPDSEYSATVKFCLKSCGQEWAIELAMVA